VGPCKLRVRYKRVQVGGRYYVRRGRFPAQLIGQNGANRQPKQNAQWKADESSQPRGSDGVDESGDKKQDGKKSATIVEKSAASGVIHPKDNSVNPSDPAEAPMGPVDSNADGQENSRRQSAGAPTNQVGKSTSTPPVDAKPFMADPSPPKSSYYGYYMPQFPANYHQPWAYPYPTYPPVYPYQHYGQPHPYWVSLQCMI
jgi:hypothetical protein